MQVSVKNTEGEAVGQAELSDAIFAAPVNKPLMHQALVRQLANARLGTHKTKGRSEVRGGGRKPWRQKGTGRARHGSIRSPQWRGGGVVFGPTPRSYAQKMPRKMRRAAVRSALTVKALEEKIVVVDELSVTEPKTREVALLLSRLSVDSSVLILTAGTDPNVALAANNLPDVKLLWANYVNVRDVLKYDYVVILQAALPLIEQTLG